jgi:RHS repeat-associated protein
VLTVRGAGGLPVASITPSASGSATVAAYYHHDVMGSTVAATEPGYSGAGSGLSYTYAGYRYDSETGLYYVNARYYNPNLGRFLQTDPIGLSGGRNLYAYVGNDPINLFDPTGLSAAEQGNDGGSMLNNPWGGADDPIVQGMEQYSPTTQSMCADALRIAGKSQQAVDNAMSNWTLLSSITANNYNGVDAAMLAAVGVRESGFTDAIQSNGNGVGYFQIDIGKNPSVTQSQALDLSYSANWVANRLSNNMASLSSSFQNFTSSQLMQATFTSYNMGLGGISGNPDTIDVGSAPAPHAPGNYGSNVLNIMNYCFLSQ